MNSTDYNTSSLHKQDFFDFIWAVFSFIALNITFYFVYISKHSQKEWDIRNRIAISRERYGGNRTRWFSASAIRATALLSRKRRIEGLKRKG
jgi:hypothetical protein